MRNGESERGQVTLLERPAAKRSTVWEGGVAGGAAPPQNAVTQAGGQGVCTKPDQASQLRDSSQQVRLFCESCVQRNQGRTVLRSNIKGRLEPVKLINEKGDELRIGGYKGSCGMGTALGGLPLQFIGLGEHSTQRVIYLAV